MKIHVSDLIQKRFSPHALGSLLTTIRAERRWTITQAADRLGFSRSFLHRAERNSARYLQNAVDVLDSYVALDLDPPHPATVITISVPAHFDEFADTARQLHRQAVRDLAADVFRSYRVTYPSETVAEAARDETRIVVWLDQPRVTAYVGPDGVGPDYNAVPRTSQDTRAFLLDTLHAIEAMTS